jgi:FHA domain
MTSDISNRCLVSGTDGFVSVTPSGRVILTEAALTVRGDDLDRIADDVGTDVALRMLGGNGGTAAILDHPNGVQTLAMTGRVAALIEMPGAEWFVRPVGTAGHAVRIPGDALRFSVALGATVPGDVTPHTAASISTPDGQPATQFLIDLRIEAESDPTPAGLDIIDLSAAADSVAAPLPVAARRDPPPPEPRDRPIVARESPAPRAATPPPPVAPAPPRESPPAPTPAPAPVGESREPVGGDESDWVMGIRCPLDHHNHPEAEYCSSCGRKMGINATAVFVKGPRPPLGLFLLNDGGAIPLTSNLLIGRDAATHDDVRAGTRQAVLLADTSNVVSRHHLAITLHDWTVTVTDLGSANGTLIINGRNGASGSLTPHQPVSMSSGDRLQIGPHTLQLQLHHIAR